MLYIYIKLPEVWKDIRYPTIKPNSYYVSSYGRVYSVYSKKILKPAVKVVSNNGRKYMNVTLMKSDKVNKNRNYIDIGIHRLVAYEFVKNEKPSIYNFVHHRNNDSTDNYYENLEWTDNQENQIEARNDGFLNPKKGESHSNAIYSDETITLLCKLIYNDKISTNDIIEYMYTTYPKKNFNKNSLRTLINHLRKGDRRKDIVNKFK